MNIREQLSAADLLGGTERLFDLSAAKVRALAARCGPAAGRPPGRDGPSPAEAGSPVFTVRGRYTARGWTEWTQGFLFGSAILQFDATGDRRFLDWGRDGTRRLMAPHLTAFGVHDHGFNNISTYGNLRRLALEGRLKAEPWELDFYELALKCSGAVQARRWTALPDGGYIHSFNGPHSLFVDTMRSLRSLALAHRLGHVLMGENDRPVSLLGRLVQHARTTLRYAVYYGEGRDAFDERGRCAQESLFNVSDGSYRCPGTQQGWSPFSTWTRGLAWVLCGCAEQLEFLATVADGDLGPFGGRAEVEGMFLRAARAAAGFYIAHTAADGIPYWDTGAPGLERLGDWRARPADPFNEEEPVDSSAAAIAAQGLLRLGHYLEGRRQPDGGRYWQAGLTVLAALLDAPYLASDPAHEGLVLHSVYHRPNGWDHVPEGRKVPCGESSLWGDYHAREAALLVERVARGGPYPTFFGPAGA